MREDGIRLGQLEQLAQGVVTVGGRLETRRGRQLKKGDVVAVGEEKVRLV